MTRLFELNQYGMHTAATLFSGGGGADIGLSGAGLDVKWGLEHDKEIAQVARDNGLDIHTADVTEVDPSWYERVDVLHASPPCPNFSVAKTGGEETDEDVSLAEATVRFADEIEPELFTLENVWGYRKSQSWKLIREHLQRSGYDWNAWKLNAANYGVPQTRKRMIVAARKGGPRPKKPPATHAENPSGGGLFGGDLNEWVGWYEAIEDLIPDLPETELADWQKERLPDELTEGLCHGTEQRNYQPREPNFPAPTCKAEDYKGLHRAVICDTQPNARGDNCEGEEPTKTVAADPAGGAPRAVLVNTNWSGENRSKVCKREETDPAFAGTVSDGGRLRAVLVGCRNGSKNFGPDPLEEDDPASTISTDGRESHRPHAVLVDTQQTSRDATEIGAQTPAMSVQAWHGRRPSHAPVAVSRRVVQMTPRALARFQTFPDWYELPDSKSLACRIIGNAVPPLLMQKCISHW